MRHSIVTLACVLIVLSHCINTMALRGLRRISCRILKHGGCDCNELPNMNFCAPVSTIAGNDATTTKMTLNSMKRTKSGPVYSTAVGKSNFRLFSIKPETRFVPTPSNTDSPVPNINEVKGMADETGFKNKVKYMWKSYGYVAIGTYLGIYLTTLTSIFLCVDFDVFNAASIGLDPAYAIGKVTISSHLYLNFSSSSLYCNTIIYAWNLSLIHYLERFLIHNLLCYHFIIYPVFLFSLFCRYAILYKPLLEAQHSPIISTTIPE